MKEKRVKKQKSLVMGTLVTGASSGIGLAFAEHYARIQNDKGGVLVMVSSDTKKLTRAKNGLEKKYPKLKILSMAIDLSLNKAAQSVLNFCDKNRVRVEVLVNNAGVGYIGAFHKISTEKLSELLLLNMYTLTRLAHFFLWRMKRRGDSGVLLNVASTAGFQSMPYFAVYAATKAYVVNLSVALAEEYRHKRVQILAVCPGPTKTNFLNRALQEAKPSMLREVSRAQVLREAEAVVRTTTKALRSGKSGIHIDGRSNKWLLLVTNFLPRKFKARIAAKLFKEFSETERAL